MLLIVAVALSIGYLYLGSHLGRMGIVAGEREGAALRGPVRSLTGLRCALLNDSLRAGS